MHENATPDPATTTIDRAAAAAADGPPALRFPFDATALTETPLTTERLVLRPLEASDAPDVFEYQRIPDVLKYLPWPLRDRAEAYEHTAKRAAARVLADDGDFFVLAMTLPGTPSVDDSGADPSAGVARDRVIGDMMVRVSSAKHAQLELGWVVHPDFQGKGYAREAAVAIRDFAFETLHPHRIQAFLDARNEASAGLCERLGMRREATILEEQYNDGEWQDTALYGVLRREWAAARG
ncbi:GNAT family N-acetyltransferase [Agromyces cerinus]|uniref:Protein N-acetyltransferase, RimJ/RimL family n=1 Tax=Agromyces cerinus subsp. cerinus TaxID=232089 RepID=A0A1N6GBE4_9MICO|nr:GNAT family protein [Agromyces cerinus]SIO04845.1 Protein N-acetyltransferase, RimJ/RimL family [Agromyces cerinus subsp. cerinus]